MKRPLVALLLAAVTFATANERLLVSPDRVIALLALPQLFGEHGCALPGAKPVPLFADAALTRPIGLLRATS